MTKAVKKQLKNYRFQMLEMRIEIISKLKEWDGKEGEHYEERNSNEGKDCSDLDHYGDCEDILETINHILSIC